MPKELRSVEALISDVVDNRRRTSESRFQPLPKDVEKVGDVLAFAYGEIAKSLASEGFRLVKSQRRLVRRLADFEHDISFQSDSGNLSGVHIGLSVHVSVRSKEFGSWLKEQGEARSDYVWASQLGYLDKPSAYLKWELVDPKERATEIGDIVASLGRLAMPVFSLFTSRETLLAGFFAWDSKHAHGTIQVAHWIGGKTLAEAALAAYLHNNPEAVAKYLADVEQVRNDPSSAMGSQILAIAKLKYGLSDPYSD